MTTTTKKADPSTSFDYSSYFTQFNPTKISEDFMNMGKSFALPGIDMEALAAYQRKNFEALTSANKAAIEGVQAITKQQAELVREAMAASRDLFEQAGSISSPQDAAAKQAELLKTGYEKALKDVRTLSDTVTKSSSETSKILNARFSESMDEARDMVLSLKA